MNRRGFTIVELLIVIVVIAILAAITIVAYNGIQNRAKQSAAQSAVSQASKKVMTWAVQNNDDYPASLTIAGVTDTTGLQYSYNNTVTPHTYGITATNGTFSYYVSNASSTPIVGGYPGHGQGGVAAIRNLALNPSMETDATSIANMGSTPGTDARSTEQAWRGSASAKLTSAGGRKWMTSETFSTGDTVSWSLWVYSPSAPRTLSTYWEATGTGGSGAGATVPANVWTRITGSVTFTSAQADKTNYGFGYLRSGSAANDGIIMYVDGVMITKSIEQYEFADGSTQNWAWTGAANNSVSTGPPQ